jgi:peptidoglycan hydrolase-like protein with peptidoglycan-binding domain
VRRTRARSRRRRPLSGRQRLARLRLEPGRTTEIQQALIREGYLQGDPNGVWDTRTRAAMLHYQTDHGFPPSGLPEAKSLMKLGLGPHPLPPELDPSQARPSAPDAQDVHAAEPPAPPASQEPPQQQH